MNKEGKYIYSIIREGDKRNFGPIGINNREVNLRDWKDIAAVVSSTPIIKFDRLAKKELTRYVTVHQKVNEQVMKDYDVVPMAFGVIAPDINEVLRILERAYLQLKTALGKIEGKVEFAVQVWWDQKKIIEDLTNTNSQIQELREKLQGSILGLPIKLKLGKLVQEGVEAQRRTYTKDIHEHLKSFSCDSNSNRLINNNKLTAEEMIANFSFLIEKARESELDKKMNELGKKYEGRLRFKYIGPMPPYSFTNINLSLGNFELVDEARKLLGLAEEVTLDEIKRAYYKLAHQYHPDKHGDDSEEFQEPMGKIAQAYSVLENYCQSCGQKQKYSFKEEDVKDSIMVK